MGVFARALRYLLFGAVLHEMLNGRRAFGSRSFVEIMAAVQRNEPSPLDVPQTILGGVGWLPA